MLDEAGDVSNARGSARAQAHPSSQPTVGYVPPPVEAWRVTHSPEEHEVTLAGGALPGISRLGTSREGSFISCSCDVSTCTKMEKRMNAASGMMSVQ